MTDRKHKTERDSPTPDKGQGIVRDDKGQEQPADKERANKATTVKKEDHQRSK
jgi:hypothetical protein